MDLRVPERLENRYGEVTWGLSTGALVFLDSRGQESPIGIGTGAQVSYGFQQFSYKKGGHKVSEVQVDDRV